MKLSAWAKQQGLSYKTAWRMRKAGQLPVPAEQLATGTVIVHGEPVKAVGAVLYARVSSSDQREELDRQLERLRKFAAMEGYAVEAEVAEVGSGLNGRRRGLLRLLRRPDIGVLIVEHRERLTRFGFEYIEAALSAGQRRIGVVEDQEMEDDVVRDLHDVIVSMCARLYGKRSARHRAQKAIEALHG